MREYLRNTAAMCRSFRTPPPGYNYVCLEEVVLEHGNVFPSAALTATEMMTAVRAIQRCSIRHFLQKQCFYNAQLVAICAHDPAVQYYEGYACGKVSLPLLHGWLSVHGKVVDLTWRTDTNNHAGFMPNRIFGELPQDWVYMGIQYDPVFLLDRMEQTGLAASVLNDHAADLPELKRPRRINDEDAAAQAALVAEFKARLAQAP